MDKYFEHLQRIPLPFPYLEHKEALLQYFDECIDDVDSCSEAINHVIFNMVDDEMNENGMAKAVNNIVSVLYLINHNVLDDVICYEAHFDIMDIETGNYNDMFTPKDLELLKNDIKIVNDFFIKHPELIEE